MSACDREVWSLQSQLKAKNEELAKLKATSKANEARLQSLLDAKGAKGNDCSEGTLCAKYRQAFHEAENFCWVKDPVVK